MIRKLTWCGIAACLVFAGTSGAKVLAAGTATIQAGDQSLRLVFDGPAVRLDSDRLHGGYLLLSGGQLYAVLPMGGQPVVMPARDAAGLLGLGSRTLPASNLVASLVKLTAQGKREAVAGRSGEVYTVVYRDAQGTEHTGRGVLGPQPEVRELTRALGRMVVELQVAAQQPAQGSQQVLQALDERGLGLLAYGTQFRLESLSSGASGVDLALPATPAGMPDLAQWLQRLAAPK